MITDCGEPPPKTNLDHSSMTWFNMDMVKNEHAVALGRQGGLKGGHARARILSPERRREIAQKAATSRWSWEAEKVRLQEDRVYRRRVAEKLARESGLDPGDLEHALFNQTLTASERLKRGLACRP
jgi:hypothetical protein